MENARRYPAAIVARGTKSWSETVTEERSVRRLDALDTELQSSQWDAGPIYQNDTARPEQLP